MGGLSGRLMLARALRCHLPRTQGAHLQTPLVSGCLWPRRGGGDGINQRLELEELIGQDALEARPIGCALHPANPLAVCSKRASHRGRLGTSDRF
jgi:hypothetical protein